MALIVGWAGGNAVCLQAAFLSFLLHVEFFASLIFELMIIYHLPRARLAKPLAAKTYLPHFGDISYLHLHSNLTDNHHVPPHHTSPRPSARPRRLRRPSLHRIRPIPTTNPRPSPAMEQHPHQHTRHPGAHIRIQGTRTKLPTNLHVPAVPYTQYAHHIKAGVP